MDRACLIGCGVMTGVGAVARVAKVSPGSSVAVFGCGAVGLNVIQGACLVQASPIVAIVLTTAAVHLFHIPVETIGSRFGSVPHKLPAPHIPRVDLATARQLLSPALPIGTTVSLLVRVEGMEIEGTGVVRTSFPGEGMGIFFTHFASPADKDRLKLLISKLQLIQSGVLPAMPKRSSTYPD